MRKIRGFRLGRRVAKVFRWFVNRRSRRRPDGYHRLRPPRGATASKFMNKCVDFFKLGAKSISNSSYFRLERRTSEQKKVPASPPKGYLAVYVSDKHDGACRVLVPVMCFNHPLFGELLREAESLYGFDHPGGIQIPCQKAELERIQMRIAAANGGGNWRRRRA